MPDIVNSVLRALYLGFDVIPLNPKDERPTRPGGLREASRDPGRVKRHWRRFPDQNYGIATGKQHGLFVLKINGEEGQESLRALFAHGPLRPLPATVRVVAANERQHYFKTGGEHVATSVGELGPGLEVQGDGGYVVGAGSIHPSGHVYQYERRFDPGSIAIASAPWLLEAFRRRPASKQHARPDPATGPKSTLDPPPADAVLAGEGRQLASATQNNRALKPGRLLRLGLIDEPKVLEQRAEKSGLGSAPSEIERTETDTDTRMRFSLASSAGPIHGYAPDEDALAVELAKLGCTDTDNADRFVRRYGREFAHCPEADWLYWDGKRWRLDRERRREVCATDTARQIAAEIRFVQPGQANREQRTAHAQRSLAKAAIGRIIEMAEPMLMVSLEKLDADPWVLNVANGTLNLRTGTLQPHDPGDLITKLAPVNYDPDAKAPAFGRFMHRVLNGNLGLFKYLQRISGYTLTGSTSEQVFFYLPGAHGNWEGTFVNNLRGMLGDYAMHMSAEMLLVKARGDNPNDFARLKGVRMATASEAPAGKQLDESRIKSMTRGDPITARFMRGEPFSFNPELKLWFVANDAPRVRSTDDALWALIRAIPFEAKISEGERDLPAKLRAEWPGILAWAVRGCLAWQRGGLRTPPAVLAASASYRKRADHLTQFILVCISQKEGAVIAASIVYRAYLDWCATAHERPLGMREFKRQFEDHGYEHARVKSGSVWREIRLRQSSPRRVPE